MLDTHKDGQGATPVQYRIRVIEAGPTYLSNGEVFHVEEQGTGRKVQLHFVNVRTGSGTYERKPMWDAFLRSGRVKIEVLE